MCCYLNVQFQGQRVNDVYTLTSVWELQWCAKFELPDDGLCKPKHVGQLM